MQVSEPLGSCPAQMVCALPTEGWGGMGTAGTSTPHQIEWCRTGPAHGP